MPEQEDSTPETPEKPTPAVAIPPIIDPEKWEDFPFLREVALYHVTDLDANAILRAFGDLLYKMMLEYSGNWPHSPEGYVRSELRAAVGDLRTVEGFLVGMEDDAKGDDSHEGHLGRVGVRVGREIGQLAAQIEGELGSWRGEGVEP